MTAPHTHADAKVLAELAERCERATELDRELDKDIWLYALGMCPHDRKVRSGAQSDTGFDCLLCGADSWGNLGSTGQRLHDTAPAYTASLDAAMMLVPDGWRRSLCDDPDDTGGIIAELWTRTSHAYANAATPALALCAAALRARATLAGDPA